MTPQQLHQRRAKKAWNKTRRNNRGELKGYNPTSAYDRISSLFSRMNELDQDDSPRTQYDRLITTRSLARNALAIAEEMVKRAPAEMVPHFKDRADQASSVITYCNERLG